MTHRETPSPPTDADPQSAEPSRDTEDGRRARSRVRLTVAGIALASLGLIGYAALAAGQGSYGWWLVVALPLLIGLVLGLTLQWGLRSAIAAAVLILALTAVATAIVGVAGIFCIAVLAAYMLLPILLGVALGHLLRGRLLKKGAGRSLTTCVALLLLPLPGMVAENRPGATGGPETVASSRVLDMTPQQAWDRLRFYEEVATAPPLLARIGLPMPLFTEGEVDGVGDVKRCVYEGGYLVKRITAYRPAESLVFEVVDQGILQHPIRLLDGRFDFAPAGPGRTRVTLTTRYVPQLEARAFWRPFEHRVTRVLHEHVLAGMAVDPPAADSGAER